MTYRVRKPSVWDVGPLLIHTHNLLHILKAGITWNHVVKRWLVVFYNAYEESRAHSNSLSSTLNHFKQSGIKRYTVKWLTHKIHFFCSSAVVGQNRDRRLLR